MKTLRMRIIALMGASMILFVVLALLFQSRALERGMFRVAKENLRVLSNTAVSALRSVPQGAFTEEITRLGEGARCRMTLINAKGEVLGDSEKDSETLENHGNRPEILEAFREGEGLSSRYSRTLDTEMIYYAKRLTWKGQPLVLRLSYSRKQLKNVVAAGQQSLFWALLTAGIFAFLGGFGVTRLLVQPIAELARSAREGRLPVLGTTKKIGVTEEVLDLARALREFMDKQAQAEEVLREERTWLQLVLSTLPVGVLVVNREGRVRYSNPPLEALFRREPRRDDPLQGLLKDPELVDCVEQALQGKAGNRSVTLRNEEENRIMVHGAPAPYGAVAIFQDVTEQYRLEEARRSFVADAGHEFQTPLTVIRAAVELLLEKASPEDRPYLERILTQQDRMTDLVDDLLLLSRIEAEKGLALQTQEEVDLVEIVQTSIKGVEILPQAEHMEWHLDLPANAPFRGWREGLLRALANLLENAVKYTRCRYGESPGGIIHVKLEDCDDAWVFSVEDNGVGVPSHLKERAFERFQRGEASSRARSEWGKGGYGLGLAIVRRMAELHQGLARLEDVQEGSLFTLFLPRDFSRGK